MTQDDQLADLPQAPHKQCRECHKEHPPTLSFFGPDARTRDGLTKLCLGCIEGRRETVRNQRRIAAREVAMRARRDARAALESLRDRQIAELTASQAIGPHEHPIRLPATDSTLQVRLHRALIDEGIQTYEKVSNQTEVDLRRYILAIGPRFLIQLYTEMNSIRVPLPRDATSISGLKLALSGLRPLTPVYGSGEPDHPPDHPNTPGCTCGYCTPVAQEEEDS